MATAKKKSVKKKGVGGLVAAAVAGAYVGYKAGRKKEGAKDLFKTEKKAAKKVAKKTQEIKAKRKAKKAAKTVKKEKGGGVKQKYEYSCAMLYFNNPKIKEIHSKIDKEDIYEGDTEGRFGLENSPHATLLYGLHPTEVSNDEVLTEIRKHKFPKDIRLHNVSCFENEEYDVLKFDVSEQTLHLANGGLAKYPHTNEYDYHPHSTIAYLKKGKGKKYVKKFKDTECIVHPKEIVYSIPSGEKIKDKVNVVKKSNGGRVDSEMKKILKSYAKEHDFRPTAEFKKNVFDDAKSKGMPEDEIQKMYMHALRESQKEGMMMKEGGSIKGSGYFTGELSFLNW